MARAVNIPITAQDRTRAAFEGASRRIDQLTGGATRLNKLFAGGLGIAAVGFAVRGLVNSLQETIDRLDEIDKASQNAAIDGETLQTWRLFGETVGATSQQVDTSLRRLVRRTGEALAGGEVGNAFRQLGIDMDFLQANANNAEAIMAKFATQLQNTDQPTLAVAAGIRILDIEGARLVRGLVNSNGSMEEFRRRLEEIGAIVPNEVLPNIAAARDQLTLLGASFTTQKDLLFSELIPAFQAVTTAMQVVSNGIRGLREGIAAFFDDSVLAGMRDQLDSLESEYRRLQGRSDTEQLRVDGQRVNVAQRRRDLLAEIQRIRNNIFRIEQRSAELGDAGSAGNVTEGTVNANLTILELAQKRLETELRNRDVQREYLRLALEGEHITQAEYDRQIALLEVKDEVAKTEKTIQELAMDRYAAEQRALEVNKALLRIKRDNKDITEAEYQEQLKKLEGIEDEKDALEDIRDILAEQRDILNEQLGVLNDIDGAIAGFEDNTRGWLRALVAVLQISKQISQQQGGGGQGGAGGFLSSLGRLFGGGGISTPAPAGAAPGGAQGASGGTTIINNSTTLPVADIGHNVQQQLIQGGDLLNAVNTDFAQRLAGRGAI